MALRVPATLGKKLERKFQLRLTGFPWLIPILKSLDITICYTQGSHNLSDTEKIKMKLEFN
jgi:hypothetical protein